MTDRINSITVVLEDNMRVDDAESLIEAIRHLRGVVAASGNVIDPGNYAARMQAKNEMLEKLFKVLKD